MSKAVPVAPGTRGEEDGECAIMDTPGPLSLIKGFRDNMMVVTAKQGTKIAVCTAWKTGKAQRAKR